MTPRPHPPWFPGTFLAGLVAQLGLQIWMAPAGYHAHEFRDLLFLQGLLEGKQLYGDLDWMYGPLYPWILSLIFKLTGWPMETLVIRYIAVAFGSAGYVGAYLLCRTAWSPGWSAFAAFLTTWLYLPPQPTYNHHLPAVAAIWSLWALARYLVSLRFRYLAAAGLLAAVSLGTKPIPLGIGLVLSLSIAAAISIPRTAVRPSWRHLAVALALTGATSLLPYAFAAAQSDWGAVGDGMYPRTIANESLVRNFLRIDERLQRTWAIWSALLQPGDGRVKHFFTALSSLQIFLDALATAWGVFYLLRRYRQPADGTDRLLALLVPASIFINCENLLFTRGILLYGPRSASLLLWVACVRCLLNLVPREGVVVNRTSMLRKTLGALVLGFPLLYIGIYRLLPLAASRLAPSPEGFLRGRFTSELEIEGLRGVKVSSETQIFYDGIATEIGARLTGSEEAAVWGFNPMLSLIVGHKDLLRNSIHLFGNASTVARGMDIVRQRRPRFLLSLTEDTDRPCSDCEIKPPFGEPGLAYRLVHRAQGKVSRSYWGQFLTFERVD